MKIIPLYGKTRRNTEQAEIRSGRQPAGGKGWTDFYTHNAVPVMAAMQECFKQEQR